MPSAPMQPRRDSLTNLGSAAYHDAQVIGQPFGCHHVIIDELFSGRIGNHENEITEGVEVAP